MKFLQRAKLLGPPLAEFCEPFSKFFRWKKIYVFLKIILADKVGYTISIQ